MGSQSVRHNWVTELNWFRIDVYVIFIQCIIFIITILFYIYVQYVKFNIYFYNIHIYACLFICFLFCNKIRFASVVKLKWQSAKYSKIQIQQFLKFSYSTNSWNAWSEYLSNTNICNKLPTMFKIRWLVDDNKQKKDYL